MHGTGVSFLPVLEHQDETRAAYDGVVDLYASMFSDRLETRPFARNMIGSFAEFVRDTGNLQVADVGCGPGHLTAMLHDLGLDAFGLDLSPGMITHARRAYPALRFNEARMEALPVEDGALGRRPLGELQIAGQSTDQVFGFAGHRKKLETFGDSLLDAGRA